MPTWLIWLIVAVVVVIVVAALLAVGRRRRQARNRARAAQIREEARDVGVLGQTFG